MMLGESFVFVDGYVCKHTSECVFVDMYVCMCVCNRK